MCICIYISKFSVTKSWACSSVPEHEFDPNTKTTQSFNELSLFVVGWMDAALGHKKGLKEGSCSGCWNSGGKKQKLSSQTA